MKIGNVIYEKELVNHSEVNYINYYKEPIEYDKLDKTLPTLYVGWSFMKYSNLNNIIIQQADILEKKIISNKLYWEFSFEENKSSHVHGLEYFINLVPDYYFISKYEYINLDPVYFQLKCIEDLMDVLPNKIDAYYKFKDETLYLLCNNKIFGLNFDIYRFFRFDVDIILYKIKEKTNTIHVDPTGDLYIEQYKILPNFTHLKRYMVTILSK